MAYTTQRRSGSDAAESSPQQTNVVCRDRSKGCCWLLLGGIFEVVQQGICGGKPLVQMKPSWTAHGACGTKFDPCCLFHIWAEGASKINQGTKPNAHQPFKLHLSKLPYQNLNESRRNHAKNSPISRHQPIQW